MLDTKKERLTPRQIVFRCLSVVVLAVALAFLGVMIKAYFDGRFDSVETMQKYISGYGAFGPLFMTVFQAAQVVLPILPGFLGCAAGSVLFGPLWGFCCNYVGISAGSVIAFWLARRFGMPLLRDLFPAGKYDKWSEKASKSRSYIVFLILVIVLPVFPDDYFCFFSGVTGMKPRTFLLIILLGKPWCILAYTLGFSLIV